MAGNVKFKLGGEQHVLRIEIRLAPTLEDATGKGFLVLARELMERTAPVSLAALVISEAFKANGKEASRESVYDMLAQEGLPHAYVVALQIVTDLLSVPERAKSGKAPAAPASAA